MLTKESVAVVVKLQCSICILQFSVKQLAEHHARNKKAMCLILSEQIEVLNKIVNICANRRFHVVLYLLVIAFAQSHSVTVAPVNQS